MRRPTGHPWGCDSAWGCEGECEFGVVRLGCAAWVPPAFQPPGGVDRALERGGRRRNGGRSLKNINAPASPPPEEAAPTPLFRDRAVSAARSRLGSPTDTLGVSSWVLTGFLGALLLAGFAFLFFTQYARVERVPGLIQPDAGAIKLTTTRAGVI